MLRFVILTACVALCVNASCYNGPTSLDDHREYSPLLEESQSKLENSNMIRFMILTACFALSVKASCYLGLLSMDEQTGNVYCQVTQTERFELGEEGVTSTCFRCSCTSSGFNCCGVGIKAGVFAPPEGCHIVTDPPCDFHLECIASTEK